MFVEDSNDIVLVFRAALKALEKPRVTSSSSAHRSRCDARCGSIFFDAPECVMQMIHAPQCAKRHYSGQVPNDTLPKMPFGTLSDAMDAPFRNALLWHMEQNNTTIADLVNETGVSRHVVNKLKARPNSSTDVENAILIAAYYGKTVNEFIAKKEATDLSRTSALLELLSPEEHRLLQLQIRGLLRDRAT